MLRRFAGCYKSGFLVLDALGNLNFFALTGFHLAAVRQVNVAIRVYGSLAVCNRNLVAILILGCRTFSAGNLAVQIDRAAVRADGDCGILIIRVRFPAGRCDIGFNLRAAGDFNDFLVDNNIVFAVAVGIRRYLNRPDNHAILAIRQGDYDFRNTIAVPVNLNHCIRLAALVLDHGAVIQNQFITGIQFRTVPVALPLCGEYDRGFRHRERCRRLINLPVGIRLPALELVSKARPGQRRNRNAVACRCFLRAGGRQAVNRPGQIQIKCCLIALRHRAWNVNDFQFGNRLGLGCAAYAIAGQDAIRLCGWLLGDLHVCGEIVGFPFCVNHIAAGTLKGMGIRILVVMRNSEIMPQCRDRQLNALSAAGFALEFLRSFLDAVCLKLAILRDQDVVFNIRFRAANRAFLPVDVIVIAALPVGAGFVRSESGILGGDQCTIRAVDIHSSLRVTGALYLIFPRCVRVFAILQLGINDNFFAVGNIYREAELIAFLINPFVISAVVLVQNLAGGRCDWLIPDCILKLFL